MKKKPNNNKKRLAVAISAVAFVLASFGTYSWFSMQKEVGTGISIAAYGIDYDASFNEDAMSNVLPGDSFVSQTHILKNTGDVPLIVEVKPVLSSAFEMPEGMVKLGLDGEYTQIGSAYYIIVKSGVENAIIDPLTISFDGNIMDDEFNSKMDTEGDTEDLRLLLTATAVQVNKSAVSVTFSTEVANKLEELGFFESIEQEEAIPTITLASVDATKAIFTFKDNEAWRNALNGITVTSYIQIKDDLTSKKLDMNTQVQIESGRITITGGEIINWSSFGDFTSKVTFIAKGHEDLVMNVASITNPDNH